MRRFTFALTILLLPLFASGSELVRQQTLIVTRHGIRVPFSPVTGLNASSFSRDKTRNWYPDPESWGGAEIAALTAHGKQVITMMGSHVASLLLPQIEFNFTVYADLDHTRRDIMTAEAFMKGSAPWSNFSVSEWDTSHPEYLKWLFNQGNSSTGACPVSGNMRSVIEGEVGGNLTRLSVEQQGAIMRLSDALDCCDNAVCGGGDNCTLMGVPTVWEGQKAYWEDFNGPLSLSAKLIEYVQLMYLNGMDWQQLVPDMSQAELASQLRLHEESMAIADDDWNALNAGSELLVHLAATMEQSVSPSKSIQGLQSHPGDALVYYAAHDINIYLLRRLLRLNWLSESFNPNESPPGGFLTFELYKDSNGTPPKYFVKIFFMTQTYDQQRNITPLSESEPASRVFVVIPGCATGPELSCPFDEFKTLVLREVNLDCVQLIDPNVLRA